MLTSLNASFGLVALIRRASRGTRGAFAVAPGFGKSVVREAVMPLLRGTALIAMHGKPKRTFMEQRMMVTDENGKRISREMGRPSEELRCAQAGLAVGYILAAPSGRKSPALRAGEAELVGVSGCGAPVKVWRL